MNHITQRALRMFRRLALLFGAIFVFTAYAPRPLLESWGDPQIEINLPRLRALSDDRHDAMRPATNFDIRPVVSPADRTAPYASQRVLILYDKTGVDRNRMYGPIYAKFMSNLLGHFDLTADIRAVSDYKLGDVEDYSTIFYIGTDPTTAPPYAFYRDLLTTGKTIVWLGDKLSGSTAAYDRLFTARYGFWNYGTLFVGEKTAANSDNANFFDVVRYKGVDLRRNGRFDTSLAGVAVRDPRKVRVRAELVNHSNDKTEPYIVQSGNFWFVSGIPFNALDADTPYLAFCDLLHDMLGIQHQERHQAMIRLEDVHAKNPARSLRELNAFFKDRLIPYSIGVIPHYKNPQGSYNDGEPEELPISGGGNANAVRFALQTAVHDGAKIIMHGYTHQLDRPGQQAGGVSAEDFEFWDNANDLPPPGETTRTVLSRLSRGLAEMRAAGLAPDYYEMPHYKASPLAYRLVPLAFARTYQRVAYFSSELYNIENEPKLAKEQAMQQYPYIIQRDYYGQYIVPENIGYLYYKDAKSSVDDLLDKARAMTVVRDGIASFFVHPFLFNSDIEDAAWSDLATVIDGISAMGYRWTNDPAQPDGATLSKSDRRPD